MSNGLLNLITLNVRFVDADTVVVQPIVVCVHNNLLQISAPPATDPQGAVVALAPMTVGAVRGLIEALQKGVAEAEHTCIEATQ